MSDMMREVVDNHRGNRRTSKALQGTRWQPIDLTSKLIKAT